MIYEMAPMQNYECKCNQEHYQGIIQTNLIPHLLEKVYILSISLIYDTVNISSPFIHSNHGNSILLIGTICVGNQQGCYALVVDGTCRSIIGRRGRCRRDSRCSLFNIDEKFTSRSPGLLRMEFVPQFLIVAKDVTTVGMGCLDLERDGFIGGNGKMTDTMLWDITVGVGGRCLDGSHRKGREDGKESEGSAGDKHSI